MNDDSLRAEALAFFARDDIWSNLVTLSEIARRAGATRVSTADSWRTRYSDFPEPIVPTRRADTGYGYMALYWWPDVQAWMARHITPSGRMERYPGC